MFVSHLDEHRSPQSTSDWGLCRDNVHGLQSLWTEKTWRRPEQQATEFAGSDSLDLQKKSFLSISGRDQHSFSRASVLA